MLPLHVREESRDTSRQPSHEQVKSKFPHNPTTLTVPSPSMINYENPPHEEADSITTAPLSLEHRSTSPKPIFGLPSFCHNVQEHSPDSDFPVSRQASAFKTFSTMTPQEQEVRRHLSLIDASVDTSAEVPRLEEIKNAPLFSRAVFDAVEAFPQYGLLGRREPTPETSNDNRMEEGEISEASGEDLIYANMNAPWSAFICGSQGGGKSHTLSCLLENCLLPSSAAGSLPNPLAGIVFHYDKFTSHATSQLCEAAYLCSTGVPVRVLVSPSNIWAMTKQYANLPGLPANAPRPQVMPLYLKEQQLNVANMMTLMAVPEQGQMPLYLEVLFKILRDMAMMQQDAPGLNYNEFKSRLKREGFTKMQNGPLGLRLQLLESFMDPTATGRAGPKMSQEDIWQFDKGSLTIVDLSCPFVNENDACALFSICLSLFLENLNQTGRAVVLDEAHKFLTQSGDAMKFTDQLVSIICQQRHLATRVFIATQEPTLSPRLLSLSNVAIVHRFLSPAWYKTLKDHLAGADAEKHATSEMFRDIVALNTGKALVFSPTAMLDIDEDGVRALGHRYFKMQVRKRLTADGGKSIMASDRNVIFSQKIDISFVDALIPPAPVFQASGHFLRSQTDNAVKNMQVSAAAAAAFRTPTDAEINKALKDATIRHGKPKSGPVQISGIRTEAAAVLGVASNFFTQKGPWKKRSANFITAQANRM